MNNQNEPIDFFQLCKDIADKEESILTDNNKAEIDTILDYKKRIKDAGNDTDTLLKIRLEIIKLQVQLEEDPKKQPDAGFHVEYNGKRLLSQIESYKKALGKLLDQCNDVLHGDSTLEEKSTQTDTFQGKTNTFNGQPLDEVRKHFSQLCNKNNPIFTESQLNDFIKRAFCGETSISKVTINLKNNKPTIGTLFYTYYNNIRNEGLYFSSEGKNTKESYAKLMSDNINNFEYSQAYSSLRHYK